MTWWKFWKRTAENHSSAERRAAGTPAADNVTDNITWSPRPGCFERHLQRKYRNPFFPAESRVMTQTDVDAARQRDRDDVQAFRKQLGLLVDEIANAPSFVDVRRALEIRKAVDDLIQRAAELGGDLGELESNLASLYDSVISALRSGLGEEHEAIPTLQWAERFRGMGNTKFNNEFIAQQGRKDSPITTEDLIPSLLSESPETIRIFMSVLDEPVRQQIRAEAVRCIANTLYEGRSAVPITTEWIQAVGIDEKNALGGTEPSPNSFPSSSAS